MTKNIEKLVYTCMADYEKAFFPNSSNQKTIESNGTAEELGVALAKESLKKIKIKIGDLSSVVH